MRAGDVINGYYILEDFTTAGGGLSKWSFARKWDREFFIKEFLSPVYPVDGAPGSEETKTRKRKECLAFEENHRALIRGIAERCGTGGNLIAALEFFRAGSKYYKITEKVDVTTMSVEEIARLPLTNRLFILRTVSHSLRILHQAEIVHADIKPGNILIKGTKIGSYTAKLIDFDNSFFSGSPPHAPEEVVGDMAFYSPEMARYIQRDKGVRSADLQTKSDIFALGLVFSLYLTGQMPEFDQTSYRYAYVACEAGQELRVPERGLPSGLVETLNCMLQRDRERRLGIDEVYTRLKALKVVEPVPPGILRSKFKPKDETRPDPPPPASPSPRAGLKGRMAPSESGSAPKLKGGLVRKRDVT